MKKVLFVASEAVPFIKTGGLADVVGSLPKCFNREEFDVRVILPKYMCMKKEYQEKLEFVTNFYLDLSWRSQYVGILKLEYENIFFFFFLLVIGRMAIFTRISRNFHFFQKQHYQHCL